MIVVMKADASQEDLDAVKRRIVEEGLRPSVVEGAGAEHRRSARHDYP